LDDAGIWDIVSFVRKMPAMSPETYQQLSQGLTIGLNACNVLVVLSYKRTLN
jgi:hypothetical protein